MSQMGNLSKFMPWRNVGNVVQKKVGGKWKKHAKASSVDNAKKMIRRLYQVERKTTKG